MAPAYECQPNDQEVRDFAEMTAKLRDVFSRMADKAGTCGDNVDNMSDARHAVARMMQEWFRLQEAVY